MIYLRAKLKLEGWHFSGRGTRGKKYGNVIASRFSVSVVAPRPRPDAPWPQLLARATVKTPIGAIDAISVGCGSFAASEIRSGFAELGEGRIRIDRERVAFRA